MRDYYGDPPEEREPPELELVELRLPELQRYAREIGLLDNDPPAGAERDYEYDLRHLLLSYLGRYSPKRWVRLTPDEARERDEAAREAAGDRLDHQRRED